MLSQPLLEKLTALGLAAFRTALEAQRQNPLYAELTFEERLGLLVDAESTRRTDNRLQRRLRAAHFALTASLEDLDLSPGVASSAATFSTWPKRSGFSFV